MDLSRFTISGSERRRREVIQANRRLIRIRWYYAGALVLIVAVIIAAIGHLYGNAIKYLVILATVYALNGLLYGATFWFKRSVVAQYIIMALQISLDLTVAISTIFVQGGLDARTTLLFSTPVIAAGLMFRGWAVYSVAIVAGVAYSGSVIAYELHSGIPIDIGELLVPVLTYPVILMAQAKLANYLIHTNQGEIRSQAHEEFLSMISHQLRHPVSVSSTILDVINSSDEPISEDTRRKIGMLKGENEDLIRTINNLLAFAGRKKPYVEDLDVRQLLEDSVRRVGGAVMRESDVELRIGEEPIQMRGDSFRIDLLFANILDNAFRYSEDGDKVTVQLDRDNDSIVCTVTDHGRGMEESQIESAIRRPYDFVSRKQEIAPVSGLNLGLYVSQEIAREHNGSVNISSKDSETIVRIELRGIG